MLCEDVGETIRLNKPNLDLTWKATLPPGSRDVGILFVSHCTTNIRYIDLSAALRGISKFRAIFVKVLRNSQKSCNFRQNSVESENSARLSRKFHGILKFRAIFARIL